MFSLAKKNMVKTVLGRVPGNCWNTISSFYTSSDHPEMC